MNPPLRVSPLALFTSQDGGRISKTPNRLTAKTMKSNASPPFRIGLLGRYLSGNGCHHLRILRTHSAWRYGELHFHGLIHYRRAHSWIARHILHVNRSCLIALHVTGQPNRDAETYLVLEDTDFDSE